MARWTLPWLAAAILGWSLWVVVGSGSAQAQPSAAGPPAPVTTTAPAASGPGIGGVGEPSPPSGALDLAVPRHVSFLAHRRSALQRELRTLGEDRPSLVPPLLLVSSGAAVAFVGVGLGLSAALSCEDRCEATSAAGMLSVGGLAALSAGLIWLQWTRDDQRLLDLRERYLQDQLGFIERASAR